MTAICLRSNYKLIYFWTAYRPIHDFGAAHRVFKVCPTQSVSEYCLVSLSAQSWQYRNNRKPELSRDNAYAYLNAIDPQMPQALYGCHFISESTELKKPPAWSLATNLHIFNCQCNDFIARIERLQREALPILARQFWRRCNF